MVTLSTDRGHETYYDSLREKWRYADTHEIVDGTRPCKRCGQAPTPEGYDACAGHVEGAFSICCGHGLSEPYGRFVDSSKDYG